jgi:microcystin-dependent protein
MAPPFLKILRSLVAGTRPSGRVYGEPYVNFGDNQFGVFDNSNVARDLIGVPIFSPNASYIAGAVVNYQGLLYIAIQAISPAAWNPLQWEQLSTSSAQTGDIKISHATVAPPGWIMWVDGTIGDSSSGSGIRANADTQALFNIYYGSPYTDAICPLLTSTGGATTRSAQGTASAAYAAHCRMTIPKGPGRTFGIAGTGSGLTARILGQSFGAETITQSGGTMVVHNHQTSVGRFMRLGGATGNFDGVNNNLAFTVDGYPVDNNGGGAPMASMPPETVINAMIKL